MGWIVIVHDVFYFFKNIYNNKKKTPPLLRGLLPSHPTTHAKKVSCTNSPIRFFCFSPSPAVGCVYESMLCVQAFVIDQSIELLIAPSLSTQLHHPFNIYWIQYQNWIRNEKGLFLSFIHICSPFHVPLLCRGWLKILSKQLCEKHEGLKCVLVTPWQRK